MVRRLRLKALGFVGIIQLLCGWVLAESDVPWQTALTGMAFPTNQLSLDLNSGVACLLNSFRPNAVVKALIILPGATDDLYFFPRKAISFTNSPTLLDAVATLTNQTAIRVTFRVPFLLLHGPADRLKPEIRVEHGPTATALREKGLIQQLLFIDKEWDRLLPVLTPKLPVDFRPEMKSPDSWHFYRANLAAWNLTGWEAVEAVCLSMNTMAVVQNHQVKFELARNKVSPP